MVRTRRDHGSLAATPAQIVQDARRHRVKVRQFCFNCSRWDCLSRHRRRWPPRRRSMRMARGLAWRKLRALWPPGAERSALDRLQSALT
ncbi:hypothetical protein CCGE525_26420 (plasmid) [Rhizobium jaguaris]|uniref:Uncharacterized protein n=1 Tax=Rhizobium jaguaris TaxID=1312183 RepID=A0A387FVA2_9HYPH|nr:hypothetical protein CCGE525_26420 [Rhizobium jaguaris]